VLLGPATAAGDVSGDDEVMLGSGAGAVVGVPARFVQLVAALAQLSALTVDDLAGEGVTGFDAVELGEDPAAVGLVIEVGEQVEGLGDPAELGDGTPGGGGAADALQDAEDLAQLHGEPEHRPRLPQPGQLHHPAARHQRLPTPTAPSSAMSRLSETRATTGFRNHCCTDESGGDDCSRSGQGEPPGGDGHRG